MELMATSLDISTNAQDSGQLLTWWQTELPALSYILILQYFLITGFIHIASSFASFWILEATISSFYRPQCSKARLIKVKMQMRISSYIIIIITTTSL
jgi:hypothetical protein